MGIRFRVEPPDEVEAMINDIFKANVLEQRQAQPHGIAQAFRQACHGNVKALAYEDDFLLPLLTAISILCAPNLCVAQKGIWRQELKPVDRQQSQFDFSVFASTEYFRT